MRRLLIPQKSAREVFHQNEKKDEPELDEKSSSNEGVENLASDGSNPETAENESGENVESDQEEDASAENKALNAMESDESPGEKIKVIIN